MTIGWKLLVLGLILSISSVSVEGVKCKDCVSSSNDKCTEHAAEIDDTECTSGNCYTLVDNTGVIKRGCVDDTIKCAGEKNCKSCNDKDGCNTDVIFSCKTCDSSSDPNCAQWTDANAIQNAICDTGITKCLMQIKDDKHIERRCLTKADEACESGKKCDICSTIACNKDLYPSDRRQCYQCDASTKCATPAANTADIKYLPCTLYDPADKCFVYATSETEMGRGCVSNTTTYASCKTTGEKCVECATNNCNNAEYKHKPSIKCIKCTSEQPNCAWGFADSAATACEKEVEYYKTEGCYTNVISSGKVDRGCIHDTTTLDCATVTGCTSCTTGNACNKVDAMDFTCHKCRSDMNPSCAKALENDDFKAPCRNTVTEAEAGCYTEKWDGIVIRSCLVDADVTTRAQCLDKAYLLCDNCKTVNCNKEAAPGSAQGIALGTGVLILSVLVSITSFL